MFYGKDDKSVTRNRGLSDAAAIWREYEAHVARGCVPDAAVETSDEVPYWGYGDLAPFPGEWTAWSRRARPWETAPALGLDGEQRAFGDRLRFVQINGVGHEVPLQSAGAFAEMIETLVEGFGDLEPADCADAADAATAPAPPGRSLGLAAALLLAARLASY